MEIMERRINFVSDLKDSLVETDPETMEETSYFDQDFLVDRYLKLTPDDKAANEAYKARKAAKDAEEPDVDPMDLGI